MSASNQKLIETFYTALSTLDAETMVGCYHDDIRFEDPAFGVLKGERARNMWRMLIASQKAGEARISPSWKVEHSGIECSHEHGKGHVEVTYVFSRSGRLVCNQIEGSFRFRDGKIIEHTDYFNLYRWARQALGLSGYVLGWSAFFKKKLQDQTNRLLDKFENQRRA